MAASTKKNTTSPARKVPQDRKPPKAEQVEQVTPFVDTPGHDLLMPVGDLTGAQQARILAAAKPSGVLDDNRDEDDTFGGIDMDKFADLMDFIGENFVVDADGYAAFSRGPGAMNRGMRLVAAYLGEMGKDAA